MIKAAISILLENQNLTHEQTLGVMREIMEGKATNAQIASFLTAMRIKGETIEEITACAMVMREKCIKINSKIDVLDIVGTGGDNSGTFNISTVSALVVASANIPVAKHGNRSVTSKCGSADLLEELGVKIDISANKSEQILEKLGICFMFAPKYHTSMKYAAPVRKELGVRTIFNILGPLSNPAGANMQILGVYDENLIVKMAKVLSNLGIKKALVVHGHDGLDEITLCAKTTICEVRNGKINTFDFDPLEFGFKLCDPKELRGESPKENAIIAMNILQGEKGPKRDIVVLNSAISIFLVKQDLTLNQCIDIANQVIDSGKALNLLKEFIKMSNEI